MDIDFVLLDKKVTGKFLLGKVNCGYLGKVNFCNLGMVNLGDAGKVNCDDVGNLNYDKLDVILLHIFFLFHLLIRPQAS